MIDINLRFQISLFGSFSDIQANSDTIKYFLENIQLDELIPNVIQPIVPEGFKVNDLLVLRTKDNLWNIEINENRIDIQMLNFNINVTKMLSLDEFIKTSIGIIKVISKRNKKLYNRIGFVTRYISSELANNQFDEIYSNYINSIDFYKSNKPIEWNNRTMARIEHKFKNDSIEQVNIISQLNRVNVNAYIDSKMEIINRIELLFDINTYQGNENYRFKPSNVEEFLKFAKKNEADLKTEYIKLLKSNND